MPPALAHQTGDETVPHAELSGCSGPGLLVLLRDLSLEAYAEVPPEAPIIWLFLNYS